MPTTTRLLLPYPVGTDTADVPRDIKALADRLETFSSINVPDVTALPGSPVDGQLASYTPAGWTTPLTIRYSTSAARWRVLAGALTFSSATDIAVNSTGSDFAFVNALSSTPSFPKGDYDLHLTAGITATWAGGTFARLVALSLLGFTSATIYLASPRTTLYNTSSEATVSARRAVTLPAAERLSVKGQTNMIVTATARELFVSATPRWLDA